jgi:hypothetical protein
MSENAQLTLIFQGGTKWYYSVEEADKLTTDLLGDLRPEVKS